MSRNPNTKYLRELQVSQRCSHRMAEKDLILTFRFRINLLPYSLPRSIFGTVNTLLIKTSAFLSTTCIALRVSISWIVESTTGSYILLDNSSVLAHRRGGVHLSGILTPCRACKEIGSEVICSHSPKYWLRTPAWKGTWPGGIVTDCVPRPGPVPDFTKFIGLFGYAGEKPSASSPCESFPHETCQILYQPLICPGSLYLAGPYRHS